MIFYVYKTTNTINGKYYIGVHKTRNIDDGYLGSGKIIRRAINKYGKHNFKKEILEFCSSYEEALVREKQLVTDEMIESDMTYNLRRGGSGGFDYINKHKLGSSERAMTKKLPKIRDWIKHNPRFGERNPMYGKTHSPKVKQLLSEQKIEYFKANPHPKGMQGRSHSRETKLLLQNKMKEKSSLIGKVGETHPTFGMKWYNNGIVDMRCKETPGIGWVVGRVFKKRKKRNS